MLIVESLKIRFPGHLKMRHGGCRVHILLIRGGRETDGYVLWMV
jgi:hypothetical protein